MKKAVILLALALTLLAAPAFAHPHLFIKPGIAFINGKAGVTGMRVQWIWDEWWSEDVRNECDLDKNGVLSDKEIKLVKSKFFDGVEDFNYFLKITANGKKVKIGKAKNFTAKILPDKTAAYEFIVDFQKEIPPGSKLEIFFFDDTIYTAFEESVRVLGDKKNIKKTSSSPYDDYGTVLTVWF